MNIDESRRTTTTLMITKFVSKWRGACIPRHETIAAKSISRVDTSSILNSIFNTDTKEENEMCSKNAVNVPR